MRHIVDGSVQRVGDRIKVTAYLVDAVDGSTVWSAADDASLDEIFDIQQRVAIAVLNALNDRLGSDSTLTTSYRPGDPKAYDEFLLGVQLWQRRGDERIRDAIKLFESAVTRDPNFARAWSALSLAYLTLPSYSPDAVGAHELAVQYARRALEIDPSLGAPYSVLAFTSANANRWLEAGRYYSEALKRSPNDIAIINSYEEFLADVGHMNESLKHTLRGYELDPVSMRSNMGAGWALTANGEPQRALEYFERAWVSSKVEPVWRGKFISLVEQDRYDEAEAWLGEHLDPANIEADVAFLRGHQDPSKTLGAADTIVKETLEGRLRSLFGGIMVASLNQEDAFYRLLSNDSSVSIRGL